MGSIPIILMYVFEHEAGYATPSAGTVPDGTNGSAKN
jgi:hypothetical protein